MKTFKYQEWNCKDSVFNVCACVSMCVRVCACMCVCVPACVRARARAHLLFPAYSKPDACFTGRHALLSRVSSSDIFDMAKACGLCRFINQTWHLWRRAPSQAVNAAAVSHVCPGPITGVPHSTAQPAADELRQGGRQLQCNVRTPGFHELVHLTADCVQFTHHWLCTVHSPLTVHSSLTTDCAQFTHHWLCTVHSPLTVYSSLTTDCAQFTHHWLHSSLTTDCVQFSHHWLCTVHSPLTAQFTHHWLG